MDERADVGSFLLEFWCLCFDPMICTDKRLQSCIFSSVACVIESLHPVGALNSISYMGGSTTLR